jgi:hypothetical protein
LTGAWHLHKQKVHATDKWWKEKGKRGSYPSMITYNFIRRRKEGRKEGFYMFERAICHRQASL